MNRALVFQNEEDSGEVLLHTVANQIQYLVNKMKKEVCYMLVYMCVCVCYVCVCVCYVCVCYVCV